MPNAKSNKIQIKNAPKGERIAKIMARSGLCSRREAEAWIAAGRVKVNAIVLKTPATLIQSGDKILVDDQPLRERERTRLWLYHKPKGYIVTRRDPDNRPTIFEKLPAELKHLSPVGRLDINTEGLLLLTNDGGLKRILELPATGWLRRYRVRVHGRTTQEILDKLLDGVTIDGIRYQVAEALLERQQGANAWITMGLREGKNREIKTLLTSIGLVVTRLIRISYGPFQLSGLERGISIEIRSRILREQIGTKLMKAAKVDFDAPLFLSTTQHPKSHTQKSQTQNHTLPQKSEDHKDIPRKRRERRKPGQIADTDITAMSRSKSTPVKQKKYTPNHRKDRRS